MAEEARYVHGLDRVIFIPCFIPPHKNPEHTAASEHRLAMTVRACENNDRFDVSDMEIQAGGTSYTVETLTELRRRGHENPYFIMGTDSLQDITAWKDYQSLFQLADFIVVSRPGSDFWSVWDRLEPEVRSRFQKTDDRLVHTSGRAIVPSEVKGLPISSTMVRTLAREGRSFRYLIPESVRSYILTHHLYGVDSP